jgi:tetratricopeptide (TPR) repeat protein
MSKYFVFILILLVSNFSFAVERVSNLITPVSYFVDHINQLQSIKENLDKYRKASVIGTSGIGKTQVVRTYAYDNIPNYDIIWFLDCNLDINDEFVKLAKALNTLNKVGISEEKDLSKKEVIDYLSLQNNWLLVFDNLKINHNNKIKEFIDWDNNGNIIFSSQDGKQLPNSIKMTTFNDKDAGSLALNLLNDKNENDVNFLVNTFKGYPILIVQGAQLLNEVKGLNKEEYKAKIYPSLDKIKGNIEAAIDELSPSSVKLLGKIALLNNQNFSKQLLNIISDNLNNIDDDIFQLSKFVLISCTEVDENNPIFEMHDIVAQKVLEINGDTKNKAYLEDIITKLTKALPATMHTGHIFRNAKTINDNLKIISNNHQKYRLNVNKLLPLYSSLLTNYINTLQYSEAEKILKWVQESESSKKFQLWSMSDENKYFYSRILSNIGGYYKHRFADWNKALVFYLKANQALEGVKGYDAIKCNVFYNLANVYISLGRMEDAEQEINKMQKMFDTEIVGKEEIGMLHLIRAKYYYYQGNDNKALEESDKDIEETLKTGIKPDDLFFTVSYMLRTGILNTLGKYKEAYTQAEQLYNMHHPTCAFSKNA